MFIASFVSHLATSISASPAILLARWGKGTTFVRLVASSHIPTSLSSSSSSSSSAAAEDEYDQDDARKRQQQQQQQQQQQRPTSRRKTRGGGTPGRGGDGGDETLPSLADFVHRAKVLRQYRNFVRLAHFVDAKDGGDEKVGGGCLAALDEVRQSYRAKMGRDMDALARTMALSEGERKLREVGRMVGYHPAGGESSTQVHDEDSWINIKDVDDRRGRVGVQWPWQRDDEKS